MKEILDSMLFVAHYFSTDDRVLEKTRARLAQLARERRGLIPSIVVAETANLVCREGGREKALEHVRRIEHSGLEIVPMDMSLAKEAGMLRCTYRHMPMADCIVAATALRERGCVVSDDPHFSEIKGLRVTWI